MRFEVGCVKEEGERMLSGLMCEGGGRKNVEWVELQVLSL